MKNYFYLVSYSYSLYDQTIIKTKIVKLNQNINFYLKTCESETSNELLYWKLCDIFELNKLTDNMIT
jgi:hypothetical protein